MNALGDQGHQAPQVKAAQIALGRASVGLVLLNGVHAATSI